VVAAVAVYIAAVDMAVAPAMLVAAEEAAVDMAVVPATMVAAVAVAAAAVVAAAHCSPMFRIGCRNLHLQPDCRNLDNTLIKPLP